MKNIRTKQNVRGNQGFTLVETVIAMGIIAILMTAFLGAFGPAVKGVQKSISRKEINRLASTLEAELAFLKPGTEESQYTSSFHKAYDWIEASGKASLDESLLLYQYRGDPSSTRSDGTFEPQTDTSSQIPGEDYVLQSVVRRLSDDEVSEELQPGVVVGRVFLIQMTQYIFENGAMTLGDPGVIIDPTEDASGARDSVTSYADYPETYIAFSADFFVLKSNINSYVGNSFSLDDSNDDGYPDATGRPAFSRNMSVMR